ncbi:DUF748 domain-containing protein [Gammaproteobacteria bacterium]|nr:DUF748 domain-containing protein [Gammaproteobacteria bacterium]
MNLSAITDLRAWYNPRGKRFWLLLLVLSYTLAGFFLAPWLIKRELPAISQHFLQRTGQVEEVTFNPWSLRLQANNFKLRDTDDSVLAAFDELIINLQVRSLFQMALVLREASVKGPEIDVTRYAFADSNIGRMLEDIEAAAPPTEVASEAQTGDGLRLVIDELNIVDGVLDLNDEMQGTPFNTRLEPISISVTNLNTLPDKTGAQQINITTETGASLAWSGSLQLNPLLSNGTIELAGSPLPLIYRYFNDSLGFSFDDCCMEVALKYSVESTEDGGIAAQINDLSVSSRNIVITTPDDNETIFELPELRVTGGELRWPEQTVNIQEIFFSKPTLNIWMNETGELNLDSLLLADETAADSTPVDAQAELSAETDTIAPAPDPEWEIGLASVRTAGMSLSFEDRSLKEPGRLEIADAEIRISEISNLPGTESPFAVTLQIEESGSLKLNGSAILLPTPVINAKLAVSEFPLPALQPWVQQVASVALDSGMLEVNGTLSSQSDEQLDFQADIKVNNLSISDTLQNVPLIGWNALTLENTRLQLNQRELEISQVKIDEPAARLVIAKDGTTNFQSLAVTSPEPATPEQSPTATTDSPDFIIKVGKTTINNGSLDFSDFSLPLPFRAPISEFGGTLSALASNSTQASDIAMEGRVGEYGFVTVGGALSVMAPTDQAQVKVAFKNISMPDLSPYTAQFAGRKILAGKLNLGLDYGFTDQKMNGENNMVLEEFQLGEKVDSPDAMNLPLDLAVGLLKDVNGVIDLDLKVSGDLEDPDFSASGIVLKAFANLIVKAAAAPFKLLGSLVPGGDNVELDAISFRAGRSDIAPPEREKLEQLSAALALRPNLMLEIPAGYNTQLDSAALKSLAVEAQVNEILGEASEGDALSKQTRKALEKLAKNQLADLSLRELRREYTPKAADTGASTFDELAYSAELRARLEANQTVEEIQLVALAETRRAAVVNQLTTTATLQPAQMKLGATKEFSPDDDDWVRIELGLEVTKDAASSATNSDREGADAQQAQVPIS